MGDVDGGDAHAVLDVLDDGAHLHPELGVQVGKGLVKQQHVRLDAQGAGQGHTLLLAAGQTLRQPLGVLVHVHQLHELVRLFADLVLRQLPVLQAELHVLPHGHVGEDGVVLEHHADVALGGVQVVDAVVVEVEVAALDAVKAGDHPQQGGLAAAGGAQQGEELALLDVHVQIRDDDVLAVLFQGVLNRNGNTHVFSPLVPQVLMLNVSLCFKAAASAASASASGGCG